MAQRLGKRWDEVESESMRLEWCPASEPIIPELVMGRTMYLTFITVSYDVRSRGELGYST